MGNEIQDIKILHLLLIFSAKFFGYALVLLSLFILITFRILLTSHVFYNSKKLCYCYMLAHTYVISPQMLLSKVSNFHKSLFLTRPWNDSVKMLYQLFLFLKFWKRIAMYIEFVSTYKVLKLFVFRKELDLTPKLKG